jgi:hypothetical protein
MAVFADEILLLIANCASQPQLATLCRVSQKFHTICIPLLYNETRLQKADRNSCLKFFESMSAHPGTIQSLHVGRDIYTDSTSPQTIYEGFLRAMKTCLEEQKELRVVQ